MTTTCLFAGPVPKDRAPWSSQDDRTCVLRVASPEADGDHCEDAAAIAITGRAVWLAVADGAGGYPTGERAAELAVRCVVEQSRAQSGGPVEAAMTAHERIVAELPSSATTLTIAAVEADRQFRVVHAGDSCVLVVGQRGKVKLRTISHSPTGYAVEAGVLEPTDALSHEDRHLVSNLLGLGDVHIEVRPAIRLAPMDTVVLGTDGLFDNLHEEELVEIVRKGPLAEACARLGALVAERMAGVDEAHPSKPDDVTIILHRPGRP